MFRMIVAAAILITVSAVAQSQSASAPLVVSATVISSCKVAAPTSAAGALLSALPVAVTCVRRGAAARVQRPSPLARRTDQRDALLVINF